MQDLEISWPEGQQKFTPEDSPVRIGRSSEAAVPLTEGSVSRRHLEFVWTGANWAASDSSTHGTFDPIGVRLAPQWNLDQDAVVRLGGVRGVEVHLRLVLNSANGMPNGAEAAPGTDPTSAYQAMPAAPEPPAVQPPPLDPQPAAPVAQQPPPFDPAPAAPAAPAALDPVAEEAGGLLFPDASDQARPPAVEPAGFDNELFSAPDPSAAAPPVGFEPEAQAPSFQAPAAPAPTFDPPQAPAPPAPTFDPPQAPAPPAPSFEAPAAPEPSFDPPQAPTPSFEAPSFDAPVEAPSMEAPPAPDSFGSPPEPGFDPPPAPPIADPVPQGSPSFDPPSPGADFDPTPSPVLGADFDPPAPPGFDAPPAPPGFDAPPAPPDDQFSAAPPPSGINFDDGAAASPPVAPASSTAANPAATIISDATLRLNVAGQDYTFLPGTDVTIGRDPSCLVQLDERHSLVSRRHLQIQFRDNGWWMEDFSSKGTYVDNRRIKGAYKAEGAFVANLGDDDAGTALRIITAGDHKVPRSWNVAVIGALAAVALIPLIALAFLLARGGSDEPDFASAKQATVMLLATEGGQGSGFFVADNLIVTNQHVAALSPQMLVAVSRTADAPAEIEYATELVANHPYLDIAVLRVTNRAEVGAAGIEIPPDPIGDIGLPSVALGNSSDITLGDAVFSTGFPGRLSITSLDDMGNLRLPPVSAVNGEAASFTIWPGCSNSDWEAFIPIDSPPGVTCSGEGDVNKGVLVSTFSSGQGASGSAVFRNNEVVAVVFAGSVDEANASLNITTDSFAGWLQEIIDNNG